ncbi:MAG: hypothetical protein KC561_08250 [Myxococcales bacterium]|nr:hypothetical protein [Myxococcales bacterium]
MQIKTRFLISTLLVGAALAACGDDPEAPPPGTVELSWLVGTSGCAQSEVETVAVLLSGEGATNVRNFDCADGGAVIEGLEPGSYSAILEGLDEDSIARFGGESASISVRSGGISTVPTIRLEALPAEVEVSWYFENGRLCGSNGVEDVLVTFFRDEMAYRTESGPCEGEILIIDEVPANTYIVDVVGRDDRGVALFNGQDELTVGRGESADIEIRLSTVDSVSTRN